MDETDRGIFACVRNLRPWPDSPTRHAGHGPRTGSNPVRDVRRNARSWPWCPRFASPAAWAAPRRAGARWSRFGGCRRTVRSAPQRRHVAPHAGAVLPRRSRGLQPPPIRLQIGSVPAKRECRGFRVLVGVKLGYIGLRPSTENTPHLRRAAPADRGGCFAGARARFPELTAIRVIRGGRRAVCFAPQASAAWRRGVS